MAGHVSADCTLGVKGQTRALLERIEQRFAEAGSDKSRILSMQIWLADISMFEDMNEVHDEWVDRANPLTRATVEAKLASPDHLVEISAIAAR